MSISLILKRLEDIDKYKEYLDCKFNIEANHTSFSKIKKNIYFSELKKDFINEIEIYGFSPFNSQSFAEQCKNPKIQKIVNNNFNEGLINYVKRKNNNIERNYSKYLKFKIFEIKNKYKNKYAIKKQNQPIKNLKYSKFLKEYGKIRKKKLLEEKEELDKQNSFGSFFETNSIIKNPSLRDSNVLSTKTSIINSISSNANMSNSMKDISIHNYMNIAKIFKINIKKMKEDQKKDKSHKINILFKLPNTLKKNNKKNQSNLLSNNNKISIKQNSKLNKSQSIDLKKKTIEESSTSIFGRAIKIKKFKKNQSNPSFL
jgi:hypothetical protein